MTDSFVIELSGAAAGIVLRERTGVRFYAADPSFYPIDRRQFRSVGTARKAAEALRRQNSLEKRTA